MQQKRIRVAAAAVLVILAWTADAGGVLYWGDNIDGEILRSNRQGTDVVPIVSGLVTPLGIDIDVQAGHLYWLDSTDQKIRRADLANPRNQVDLVDIGPAGYGLALDLLNGKIYWTERGDFDGIRRADLDGDNVELVVTTGQDLTDLAVDPVGGHVYLLGSGEIRRFDLAGGGSTQLVDVGTVGLGQIDLDLVNGKMYWSNSGVLPRSVWRADLSGANDELFVESGGSDPVGVAVDPFEGRVYWTDTSSPSGGLVQSANLEGEDVQTLVQLLPGPQLMVLPESTGAGCAIAALLAIRVCRGRGIRA